MSDSLGYFDLLPNEVCFPIFEKLSITDALICCQVSKGLAQYFSDDTDVFVWKQIALKHIGNISNKQKKNRTFRLCCIIMAKTYLSFRKKITQNDFLPPLSKLLVWCSQNSFFPLILNVWERFSLHSQNIPQLETLCLEHSNTTPLLLSAQNGSLIETIFFLNKGFSPSSKSQKKGQRNKSALELACQHNHIDVVEYLLSHFVKGSVRQKADLMSILEDRIDKTLDPSSEEEIMLVELIEMLENVLRIAALKSRFELLQHILQIKQLYYSPSSTTQFNKEDLFYRKDDIKKKSPLISSVIQSEDLSFIKRFIEKYKPDISSEARVYNRYTVISLLCSQTINETKGLLILRYLIEEYPHLKENLRAESCGPITEDEYLYMTWPLLVAFRETKKDFIDFFLDEINVPFTQQSNGVSILQQLIRNKYIDGIQFYLNLFEQKFTIWKEDENRNENDEFLKILWHVDTVFGRTVLHDILTLLGSTFITCSGNFAKNNHTDDIKEKIYSFYQRILKLCYTSEILKFKPNLRPDNPRPVTILSSLLPREHQDFTNCDCTNNLETKKFISVIEELVAIDPETCKPELYDYRAIPDYYTLLELAISRGLWDLIDWLLEKDEHGVPRSNPKTEIVPIYNCLYVLGTTPIGSSPTYMSKVFQLWERLTTEFGFDVNEVGGGGKLPYAYIDNPELLIWIFEHYKLNFEIVDDEGKMPLHNLVNLYNFSFLSIDRFLKAGADKTINTYVQRPATDTSGNELTPLMLSLMRWKQQIVDFIVGILLLVSYGADINQKIYLPGFVVYTSAEPSSCVLDYCRLKDYTGIAPQIGDSTRNDLCLLVKILASSEQVKSKAQIFVQQYRDGLLDSKSKIKESIKELFDIDLELLQ